MPSATVTLRSGPRLGERLKRALNSSWVTITHSISDDPSSPSRAKEHQLNGKAHVYRIDLRGE